MKREKGFTPLLKEGRGFIHAPKNGAGFTLIELMVVVVILAVLAGVALPRFKKEAEKARESTCWDDIDGMGTALESYGLIENDFPATLDLLQTHTPPFIRFKRDYNDPPNGIPDTPWSKSGAIEEYGYATWATGYSLWVGASYDSANTARYMNKGLQFRFP